MTDSAASRNQRESPDGPAASPVARRLAAELGLELGSLRGSGPRGRILRADVEAAALGAEAPAADSISPSSSPGAASDAPASPGARKLAEELGVDLSGIAGTGPGGRIVRVDVETAATRAANGPLPREPMPAGAVGSPPVGPPVDAAKGETTRRQLSRVQKIVARRMAEAKATIPEFTVQTEVDMARALTLRAELKEVEGVQPPSINDIVVRAVAVALREHPRANGAFLDDCFELYSRVNVGIAVASSDALIVPTIFDADVKSIDQIARESRNLAERARAGTITAAELAGGTFTVSNLGMFGVTRFSAVINPPQAAILAVGATVERMRVREGEPRVTSVMDLTLSSDHRILYGADAARFLARIRELLEHPVALLLTAS